MLTVCKIIDVTLAGMFALAAGTAALADATPSAECLAAREALAKYEALAQEQAETYKSVFDRVEAELSKPFAGFDAEKTMTLTGTVTEFRFTSPRAQMTLTVGKDDGQSGRQWTIAMISPAALVREGWHRNTLVPGMLVTLMVHPARDGANSGQLVSVTLPDGTQMEGGRPGRGLRDMHDHVMRDQRAVAEHICRSREPAAAVPVHELQRLLQEMESEAQTYQALLKSLAERFGEEPRN
jgi:hypothetical protein